MRRILLPLEIKSATGAGGLPDVRADFLSNISLTASGLLTKIQVSHPNLIRNTSPYSKAQARNWPCGCELI